MVTLIEGVGWGLILLAGIGYTGIAASVYRHHEFPGKSSFVASCFLVAGLLYTVPILLAIVRLDHGSPLINAFGWILQFVAFASGLLAPLAWVRFALLFTGQGFPTDRPTSASVFS